MPFISVIMSSAKKVISFNLSISKYKKFLLSIVLVIKIELTSNEQSPLVMNKGRGKHTLYLSFFYTGKIFGE